MILIGTRLRVEAARRASHLRYGTALGWLNAVVLEFLLGRGQHVSAAITDLDRLDRRFMRAFMRAVVRAGFADVGVVGSGHDCSNSDRVFPIMPQVCNRNVTKLAFSANPELERR